MDQVSAGSRGTWPQSLGYRSSRTIACPCRCSSWWRHSPQPHGCPDRNLSTKNMGADHFDIAAGLLLPRFTTLIISMTVCMFITHSREQTQIQPQVSPQMLVYNRKLAQLRCLAKCNEVLWGYEFGFTVIFIHVHSTHKKTDHGTRRSWRETAWSLMSDPLPPWNTKLTGLSTVCL